MPGVSGRVQSPSGTQSVMDPVRVPALFRLRAWGLGACARWLRRPLASSPAPESRSATMSAQVIATFCSPLPDRNRTREPLACRLAAEPATAAAEHPRGATRGSRALLVLGSVPRFMECGSGVVLVTSDAHQGLVRPSAPVCRARVVAELPSQVGRRRWPKQFDQLLLGSHPKLAEDRGKMVTYRALAQE